MKIKRIYIRNFGIFANQTLENLHPGLVVIGGKNRAGKSTFLQILRAFGWGFRLGENSLPETAGRYEVEGDLYLSSQSGYNLRLLGFAEPEVTPLFKEGKPLSGEEIYNNLDAFTYKQLFTISLDELQAIPKGVSSKKVDQLQSVLLGAGLRDLVQLPQLEDEFTKEAEKIGGRLGNPKVKEFKPYYEQIQEGIQLRTEALGQVELYQKKKKRLGEIDKKVNYLEGRLIQLRKEKICLDLLMSNYEDFRKQREKKLALEKPDIRHLLHNFPNEVMAQIQELQPEYQKEELAYQTSLDIFKQKQPGEDWRGLKERLLACADEIEGANQNLSGLQERVQQYWRDRERYRREKEIILQQMDELNQHWQGDFQQILQLPTDQLAADQLQQAIVKYQELLYKKRGIKERIEEQLEELAFFERQLDKNQQPVKPTRFLLGYFVLALLSLGGGAGLFFYHQWAGIGLGLTGVIGLGLASFVRYASQKSLRDREEDLTEKIEHLEYQQAERQEELTELEAKVIQWQEKLYHWQRNLGIEKEISPDGLKEYFHKVQDMKRAIYRLQTFKKEVQSFERNLVEELGKVALLVEKLGLWSMEAVKRPGVILKEVDELSLYLERAHGLLELARDLDGRERSFRQLVEKVAQLLGVNDQVLENQETDDLVSETVGQLDSAFLQYVEGALRRFLLEAKQYQDYHQLQQEYQTLSDRILQTLKTEQAKDALGAYFSHPGLQQKSLLEVAPSNGEVNELQEIGLLELFGQLYENFTSLQAVKEAYATAADEQKMRSGELERARELRQTLRDEINRLATAENLEKAQQRIDNARAQLRPLAEKYALNRTAAFVLNQVRQRFLSGTQETLLQGASKIIQQLSGGEYAEILPVDDLTESDFQTRTESGMVQGSTDYLSRGTQEQLFLAVRLSRIQEIQPSLPVILDDTLVNFDSFHQKRALKILVELARTHQVFILTCHPQLIHQLVNYTDQAQYWHLDMGRFQLTDGSNLVEQLL